MFSVLTKEAKTNHRSQSIFILSFVGFLLVLVQPPSGRGYERESRVPGRTTMLLLRSWDDTLAGNTQGKAILMHGASSQPELLTLSRPRRDPPKQPIFSPLLVFVLQLPRMCSTLDDGCSKTPESLFCFVSHARFA